jgi:hypothetical protein
MYLNTITVFDMLCAAKLDSGIVWRFALLAQNGCSPNGVIVDGKLFYHHREERSGEMGGISP